MKVWKLSLNGPVVSEEKMFEDFDRQADYGRTSESMVYYRFIHEPSTQVN